MRPEPTTKQKPRRIRIARWLFTDDLYESIIVYRESIIVYSMLCALSLKPFSRLRHFKNGRINWLIQFYFIYNGGDTELATDINFS